MARKLTVSISEIISFQSCRRRWLLGRQWDKAEKAPALWFGDGIHKALEAYNNLKIINPSATSEELTTTMSAAFEMWYVKQETNLAKEYGMLWDQGKAAFESMIDIGWQMLKNYVEYDKTAAIQFRPLLVEKLMYLPMGDNNYISLKMDIIAESDGDIGPVDNKTSNGRHSQGQMLDVDEQMTGYGYAFWRITERIPDFIGYNVLAKEAPSAPKLLKNGKELSTDKRQKTTRALFLKAIQENGFSENDYEDMLDLLEAKGWEGFFDRETSPRNQPQLENFEKRAKLIMTEMRHCLDTPEMAYPSFSSMKCPGCPFLTVCSAMEAGEDYEYLLNTSYTKKVDSPWMKRKRDMERNV